MDMVLVSKFKAPTQGDCQRAGRPSRTGFCIRIYGQIKQIGLPNDECREDDKIDFLVSDTGFAVRIGPHGERAISKHRTGKTATLPIKIFKIIPNLKIGKVDLISEKIDERTWFFPFKQFEETEQAV